MPYATQLVSQLPASELDLLLARCSSFIRTTITIQPDSSFLPDASRPCLLRRVRVREHLRKCKHMHAHDHTRSHTTTQLVVPPLHPRPLQPSQRVVFETPLAVLCPHPGAVAGRQKIIRICHLHSIPAVSTTTTHDNKRPQMVAPALPPPAVSVWSAAWPRARSRPRPRTSTRPSQRWATCSRRSGTGGPTCRTGTTN